MPGNKVIRNITVNRHSDTETKHLRKSVYKMEKLILVIDSEVLFHGHWPHCFGSKVSEQECGAMENCSSQGC